MAREPRSSRSSSNAKERFKYGQCLNDECQNCKDKKIIQLKMREDMVCPLCGSELRECTPPPPPPPIWKYVAIGVAAVAVIGGGCYLGFGGGKTESAGGGIDTIPTDTAGVDTVKHGGPDTIKVAPPQEPGQNPGPEVDPGPTPGPKPGPKVDPNPPVANLGYAKFVGPVKGGKPNGQGRMTFNSSHLIDSRDPKGRVADAGDYVIGEWSNGKLVQGTWYGSDNNVKGSIIVGM